MYSKKSINTSAEALNTGKNLPNQVQENQELKIYNKEKKRARNQGLSHLYHNDYKPAVYKKAVEFKDSMSYKKKIGQHSYKQIQLFEDTNELKAFGLGPYFFIEFQRRIVWLFLILSILQGVRIYVNCKGTGLSSYQGSFSTYLVATTIGNFNQTILSNYDIYIMTIIPAVVYATFFVFYLWWKCHYSAAIEEENESKDFVKPQKFCVEIEGFDENDNVKQEELENIFSGFGPVYEVSLARQYAGNLKYFQELDGLEEQIKEEQLEIILGSGDQENLKALRKQKDQLSKYINTLRIKPSVRSAFVHFQFQKSKVDMLQYFSDHYLFSNKNSHSIMRGICCCCIDDPDSKYMYRGKKLYIMNDKVPEPEDINWDSYQVGFCGKIFRILFSALIILVFLAVSCTIIGLCSVYISSHSVSCEGVSIPPNVKQAQATLTTQKEKKCFCNANFIGSFNSPQIKNYCGDMLNQVYTQQGIQYAITATSTVVNLVFCFIVHKLVNMAQPASLSTGYLWKTSIITIFLIFNTVLLPLLIYADIFGFKATNYVSFITIVSVDARNFFNVDSINFYVDYEKIWYRNVSPIFTNYIVLDFVLTWAFFIFYKCCCSKQSLESKEGSILQKNMNLEITSWKLQAADEFAMFNLIIFMSIFYSCGIPALIPLAFFNLLSKYISNRNLLQSTSSRIDGLSEAFNSFPITLLPLLLMIACVNGSWMLTGNQLIYNFRNMKIDFGENNWWVFDRQLILPFFIILAIVILFYFAFYNTVVRFCAWLAASCYDQKKVVHPYYTREYSHYAKTMSIMHSYNIRNNLRFKNIIFNLQKYLDSQQLKM